MAGLGYYEGFVPYVSNQYKKDAESFNRPLSDKYILIRFSWKVMLNLRKNKSMNE